MELIINNNGNVRCVYNERIDLSSIGKLAITRASHVEPDTDGAWIADMMPVAGPKLGPFAKRSEALAAETTWLRDNVIV